MRLLLALLVALPPGLALAAGYYVNDATATNDVVLPGCAAAPLGIDMGGCGTCALPCRTPNYLYAITPLAAGDIVHLNAGTYTEVTAVPVLNLINTIKSGTALSPITFRGVVGPTGRPLTVLDGSGVASAGVRIQTPWITIENVAVTRFACSTSAPFGSGIQVAALPIVGVSLVNLEVFGTVCPFGAPIDFDSTAAPCTGCRIVDCFVHDNGTTAGGIYTAGAGGLEIRRNVITGNTLGNAGFPAIVLSGSGGALVEGNLVYGNGGTGLSLRCNGCAPATVRGNTFWGNQLGTSGASVAEIAVTTNSRLILEHNLIGTSTNYCVDLDNSSSLVRSDYNDLFPMGSAGVGAKGGTTAQTLALWRAATLQDTNSISIDPLFVSATDYHLSSVAGRPGPSGTRVFDAVTSPAIDRADPLFPVALELAPNGGRADLGAYGTTAEASLTPVVLVKVRGEGQRGPPGVQFAVPLEVEVTSPGSRPEPGVGVAFAVTSGSGSLTNGTALTDAAGKASTLFTPGAGGNSVLVSLVNVGGAPPVAFTATGVGIDAGSALDAGSGDAGSADAGSADAGSVDAGSGDGGAAADGGSAADGGADAGSPDAGSTDGGADGGAVDAGGAADAGSSDAGSTDGGSEPREVIIDLGCGCSSSDAPAFLLLGLARRFARRSRRSFP